MSSGNEATSRIQAEDFTLTELTALTAARFWAFYFTNPGYLGTVEWGIHANDGGQPGRVLFSGLATPTVSAGVANCCDGIPVLLEFALPDVPLAAGTYWLALHNGAMSNTGNEDFYWQTTDANGTTRGREQAVPFGGSHWIDTNLEHAFELHGSAPAAASEIPEPGTFFLAGLAGLVLALRRRDS